MQTKYVCVAVFCMTVVQKELYLIRISPLTAYIKHTYLKSCFLLLIYDCESQRLGPSVSGGRNYSNLFLCLGWIMTYNQTFIIISGDQPAGPVNKDYYFLWTEFFKLQTYHPIQNDPPYIKRPQYGS